MSHTAMRQAPSYMLAVDLISCSTQYDVQGDVKSHPGHVHEVHI